MDKEVEEDVKAQKKAYLERKKKMISFEKNNYSAVVFFEGMNGFYIAGGHSAIILYNLIAPELGLKISISKDRDFERRFSDGILNIRNLEKYKELISQSSYVGSCVQTKHRLSFALKNKISKSEYEILANAENIKREKLVNMVSSSKVMPKTYQALRNLMKVSYKQAEKRSDAVSRELLTRHVVEGARMALLIFLSGCKQTRGYEIAMDQVDDALKKILSELIVIEAADVWAMPQVHKVSYAVMHARDMLSTERKEYENAV